jgi:predicted Zn-dependent protease
MTMNQLAPGGLVALILAGLLASCESAPVTGRNQLILVPEDQAAEMGAQAYEQIVSEADISDDSDLNAVVNEVGERITAVAEDPGFDWEFTVFEDEAPNAFALPGGKVGVNTGLFDVAENEDQLAAVMAHEIAHAVAQHSNERMSRQLLLQAGLAGAGLASDTVAQYGQLLAQAATLGVVLPFSREQEAEADQIGLIYMAKAGYDPRAAIELWENLQAYGGEGAPEFLSTHPSPGNRIERLEEFMPQALEVYEEGEDG